MQKLPQLRWKPSILFLIILLSTSFCQAQKETKIDWKNDIVSKGAVDSATKLYVNNIKGGGQPNATKQINLPVDKLKEILDSCAAHYVTDIAVIIISLRASDVARYRRLNPGSEATDAQIKGSQMLVFKVPSRAFGNAAGAKINLSKNNPFMMSLLSTGLVFMDSPYSELQGINTDYYFSFGTICPPPASCSD
jgi:hypothetical protein